MYFYLNSDNPWNPNWEEFSGKLIEAIIKQANLSKNDFSKVSPIPRNFAGVRKTVPVLYQILDSTFPPVWTGFSVECSQVKLSEFWVGVEPAVSLLSQVIFEK